MLVFIDQAGADLFEWAVSDSWTYRDVRHYYYAWAPYRAMLVCQDNLQLPDLVGSVVEVLLGTERVALREFVRPGLAGQPHSRLTVHKQLPLGNPELTLSALLDSRYVLRDS